MKTTKAISKITENTVKQLNDIQRQWMALDSNGPKDEINRVCNLMKAYPRIYISGHDGYGNIIIDGMPLMAEAVPMISAIESCRQYGGWTDVAWNGTKGEWYAL